MRSVGRYVVVAQLSFSFLSFFAVVCVDSCLINLAHTAPENTGRISTTRTSDAIPTDCMPSYRPDLPCVPLNEIQKMMDAEPDAPNYPSIRKDRKS